MKTGVVFNIQKFSINDGPGIRTTVFLKGCPLRCIWCHNPESKSTKQQLFYDARKCVGCGRCAEACPNGAHKFTDGTHTIDRDLCTVCGACAGACIPEALEVVGEEKTVDEVIREVMKDKAFYDNSGGGITVSGGEPMLQFEFTLELLKAAKESGLHTAMETCGFAKPEQYREIAPYVDLFLYDYKETDSKKHKEFTGADNDLILSNLRMLNEMGANLILRCPIIPTLNDREEHFRGIAKLAKELDRVSEVHIEPYHPLGSGKADLLDIPYELKDLTFPENDTVQKWIDDLQSMVTVPVKKA